MTEKTLTPAEREKVGAMVGNTMELPADDEMVALFYGVYKRQLAAGEIARNPELERECEAHLKGTEHEGVY